ncbi:uncharacterized protein NFIA_032350 [Aspergillus fischeri NRRL 181]|uniref:Uncharacterized protein n=1 Tax=Neosartorya fischeri (strain ATCC 1020 / DSM 3700 / CBS 544.65 / FGSC A1164 / JCM 1740 / NRRL 181 / WB 181) TaxID=331117 RepID=A1CY51_NEOFI|nr:uncharacterized protein NFIA_032350 [Aspergillus fischeri NRRL 181]EAW23671.1 hypothetical protein NFIA_032350 [Aspergillus fischeri NRRL 181]
MLKELVKKRDEGSIRKALDEAPNGLSQMIRHVLKDISESLEDSPQYAEDLNEMLTWATCSRRSSDWPKMERPARVRSAKAVCFAPSPQRKDGLATTQLQRRAIYMGEADTHHWRLYNIRDAERMPRWETFSEVNRTVKSADGCPPIGVSFHEAKVTLIKRYHEFISYPEDSPRSDIAAVLPFRASRSVIPALKDIDIHQCREEGKQTIGIYPARLFFGQWAMPRFVMFTGDVPLLEDIRDLFMTWLTGSDMQEALPPVEKG